MRLMPRARAARSPCTMPAGPFPAIAMPRQQGQHRDSSGGGDDDDEDDGEDAGGGGWGGRSDRDHDAHHRSYRSKAASAATAGGAAFPRRDLLYCVRMKPAYMLVDISSYINGASPRNPGPEP